MRVFEVMTEGVRTVPPALPATEGWEVMRTEGIHHLVVTLDKRVVGVLSDRDAGGPRGAQLRAGAAVGDLMTRDVVTVQTSDTVGRAANLMRGRTIGCVTGYRREKAGRDRDDGRPDRPRRRIFRTVGKIPRPDHLAETRSTGACASLWQGTADILPGTSVARVRA